MTIRPPTAEDKKKAKQMQDRVWTPPKPVKK